MPLRRNRDGAGDDVTGLRCAVHLFTGLPELGQTRSNASAVSSINANAEP